MHLNHSQDDIQYTSTLANVIFLTVAFITNMDSVTEKVSVLILFCSCSVIYGKKGVTQLYCVLTVIMVIFCL